MKLALPAKIEGTLFDVIAEVNERSLAPFLVQLVSSRDGATWRPLLRLSHQQAKGLENGTLFKRKLKGEPAADVVGNAIPD